MQPHRTRAIVVVALGFCLAGATIDVTALFKGSQTVVPAGPMRWYKGNTHTHTVNSDGDSTPDDVVRWYREHRYQFLVLTDHNFLTSRGRLERAARRRREIPRRQGRGSHGRFGGKPLHINGLDVQPTDTPQGGTVDRRRPPTQRRRYPRRRSAVPHINHPNFQWAITGTIFKQVRNNTLFEIFNGHPT